MHELTEIIVTSRLRLRSPIPSDFQLLHDHVLSDAAVMKLALSGQPMSLPQSREFIHRNFDHDGSGKKLGVLIERTTGEVIGFAGLLHCDVLGEADMKSALSCVVLFGVGDTPPRLVAGNSNMDLMLSGSAVYLRWSPPKIVHRSPSSKRSGWNSTVLFGVANAAIDTCMSPRNQQDRQHATPAVRQQT